MKWIILNQSHRSFAFSKKFVLVEAPAAGVESVQVNPFNYNPLVLQEEMPGCIVTARLHDLFMFHRDCTHHAEIQEIFQLRSKILELRAGCRETLLTKPPCKEVVVVIKRSWKMVGNAKGVTSGDLFDAMGEEGERSRCCSFQRCLVLMRRSRSVLRRNKRSCQVHQKLERSVLKNKETGYHGQRVLLRSVNDLRRLRTRQNLQDELLVNTSRPRQQNCTSRLLPSHTLRRPNFCVVF